MYVRCFGCILQSKISSAMVVGDVSFQSKNLLNFGGLQFPFNFFLQNASNRRRRRNPVFQAVVSVGLLFLFCLAMYCHPVVVRRIANAAPGFLLKVR